MDPADVPEDGVTTGVPAEPVAPAETVAPVPYDPQAPASATAARVPATEAPAAATPVAAAPAAATPVAAAPAAAAPVAAPVYTTGVNPTGYRLIQLVWLLAGVVDLILILDFAFRAAGAAHKSGFAHYIYRIAGWLSAPFEGIFNNTVAANGTSEWHWADVLAVVVYTAAAWIVTKLVRILSTPRTGVSRV